MMTARRVPLIDLVQQGQIKEVKKLIEQGCDVDEKTDLGNCAVLSAVERNDSSILEILIKAGANVDVQDLLGRSALFRAKQLEFSNVAKLIEEALNQKNVTESTYTPSSSSNNSKFPKLFAQIERVEEHIEHTPPKTLPVLSPKKYNK